MSRDTRAAADDDVIERGLADFLPLQFPLTSISARDSYLKFTASRFVQRVGPDRLDGTAVRNPRPPILMPSNGVVEPAISRAAREHRAVAAENQEQVRFPRERRDIAVHNGFAPGAFDEPRGLADDLGASGLSELPISPTRLDFSSAVFQSTPKILCCPPGRAAAIPPRRASQSQFARQRIRAILPKSVREWKRRE